MNNNYMPWQDEYLVFYKDFPAPENVRRAVSREAFRHPNAKITEKLVLSHLRHFYTNYNLLLSKKQWEHDFLKERVNQLILERIGDNWK